MEAAILEWRVSLCGAVWWHFLQSRWTKKKKLIKKIIIKNTLDGEINQPTINKENKFYYNLFRCINDVEVIIGSLLWCGNVGFLASCRQSGGGAGTPAFSHSSSLYFIFISSYLILHHGLWPLQEGGHAALEAAYRREWFFSGLKIVWSQLWLELVWCKMEDGLLMFVCRQRPTCWKNNSTRTRYTQTLLSHNVCPITSSHSVFRGGRSNRGHSLLL